MDKKYEVAIRSSTRILHCLRSPTFSSIDSEQLSPVSRATERGERMNTQQLQYTGTLYFGTPASPFTVRFDIYSPWTWLNKVGCQSCHTPAKNFDPSKSTTYKRSGEYFVNNYLTGEIVYDTVSFDISQTVSIQKQAFILANSSNLWYNLRADGYAVKRYTGTGTH